MKKKVCQMVWNQFTNDARVLRECTSLSESGYEVKLICLGNKKEGLAKREIINGFEVIRIERCPKVLETSFEIIKKIKNKNIYAAMVLTLYILILKTTVIGWGIISIIVGLLYIKKVRSLIMKITTILKMISEGIKYNADIYHSNDLNTVLQGIICSKIRGKKLIYDSHEVQSSRTGYNGKRIRKIEKFLLRYVSKLIMTTETRAEYTMKIYNIEKPSIIHNYPFNSGDESIKNKKDIYKQLNISRDRPILLYQGGIQVGRGLDKIVEAIPLFKDGVVVFIGDGKIKESLKERVKALGVEEKVRFLDKVPVNELKYYTANAYLGFQVLNNVCFNHYSALSNKLFEYIMSDIPVIACSFPEIKKVVSEAEVGICVNSEDFKEIANSVNKLLEDKELHKKMKQNCKSAKEIYNWDNEKYKFVKIYDDILGVNREESEYKNEELKVYN